MSDFKAKMHQIRFRLGLRPRPHWGAYSAPLDPIAGFERPTSKGGVGKEERMRGEGMEEKGGKEGREGEGREEEAFLVMWPRRLSALNPPLDRDPQTVTVQIRLAVPPRCAFGRVPLTLCSIQKKKKKKNLLTTTMQYTLAKENHITVVVGCRKGQRHQCRPPMT